MKKYKQNSEIKIQSLEKENQILNQTNDGLYRKIATLESEKI